ncbi:aminopeptidase P family protein [Pseudoruegeria sp. SHC-113]|uniref:aminopeptidase P family protein n=1 Tax=Pseudoruegeria sp. SHC-113 TaxID=2855439 RepID=UPI0021BB0AF1|nr:aminopeptidase P family protein [Pseudoruegeria sp. SHC-113]MCT8161019.1 aminopeptidase P family protein [Pseudoruegeria sp. SHC-113]
MFQTFTATSRPEQGPPRLARLRAELAAEGLTGFLVPRADVHQGEYVAPCDERLSWLTGFTGSAGFCIALTDVAGVFIDGRYRVQVRQQVDTQAFTPVPWPETQPGPWLAEQLPDGGRVGFDPWLHTAGEIAAIEADLDGTGISLVPCRNLVDAIWEGRPARPQGKAFAQPLENAGETAESKCERLAEGLLKAGQKSALITLPDSLCWLLNIRGSDIPRNPIAQGFCVLFSDGRVALFMDPEKLVDLADLFGPLVTCYPQDAFAPFLANLTGPVRVDKASAPLEVSRILADAGVEIVYETDPCILPKACKNDAEIAGTREAHLRDAVAMVRFLAWLDAEAPKGGLSEIDVVQKLEAFRRADNALREISFETIAGAGPNGAIMHYRVTEGSNRAITPGDMLVLDSGGQYVDGTTDITRTIATGPVTEEQKACFTRVLQGMIAISRVRFPRGLAGRDLDPLARYPLWLAGQDFDHGTGHGVGVYLSVHEGPQRISRISHVKLEPGMILSNEPGYYREGAFGIRIENLIVVQEAEALGDGRDMLDFETLTWVPIDRRPVAAGMLSGDERAWLNAYHAEILARLAPRLEPDAAEWLAKACAPI